MFVGVPVFWLVAALGWAFDGPGFWLVELLEGALFYYLGGFFWFLGTTALYAVLVSVGALLTRGRIRRVLPFLLTPAIVLPVRIAGAPFLDQFPLPALASALLLGWLVERRMR